jgi:hypothetical protein
MEKHRVKRIGRAGLIFVCCVVLLFLLALAAFAGFPRENTGRQVVYFDNKPKAAGYLVIMPCPEPRRSELSWITSEPSGDTRSSHCPSSLSQLYG